MTTAETVFPLPDDSLPEEIPPVLGTEAACNPEESLEPAACPAAPSDNCPDLWLYRERTLALLKRYMRLSVEVGRLPSLLGREFFRSRITSYQMCTCEEAIIFVHDVRRSLDRLDQLEQDLIAAMVFQERTQDETAYRLRCGRRTVVRRFPEALDKLSELFLCGGLLRWLPQVNSRPDSSSEKTCQEGENGEFLVSDSECSE